MLPFLSAWVDVYRHSRLSPASPMPCQVHKIKEDSLKAILFYELFRPVQWNLWEILCRVRPTCHTGSPLPQIIQWFKTMTTNEYIKMVKQNILPSFDKRIWQRNYYEHIIRNENEYNRMAGYIQNNPMLSVADCYCYWAR